MATADQLPPKDHFHWRTIKHHKCSSKTFVVNYKCIKNTSATSVSGQKKYLCESAAVLYTSLSPVLMLNELCYYIIIILYIIKWDLDKYCNWNSKMYKYTVGSFIYCTYVWGCSKIFNSNSAKPHVTLIVRWRQWTKCTNTLLTCNVSLQMWIVTWKLSPQNCT